MPYSSGGAIRGGQGANHPLKNALPPLNFEWNQEENDIFLYKVVKTDYATSQSELKNSCPPPPQ